MTEGPVVRVAILDVGQGDTIVVSVPDTREAVVIDCVDAEAVLAYLESEKITRLAALIITHLHVDHYKGAIRLIQNVPGRLSMECEKVIFNWAHEKRKAPREDADLHSTSGTSARERTNTYRELWRWTSEVEHRQRCTFLLRDASGGRLLDGAIGGVIDVLQPWHGQIGGLLASGVNNTSAVIKVRGAGTSALLTGDIEPAGWIPLAHSSSVHADVLKFPHHGAWVGGDAASLLADVQPSIVVMSVGTEGTRYKHPNVPVFDALAARAGVRVLCTQATTQCGAVDAQNTREAIAREHHEESERVVPPGSAGVASPGRAKDACSCAGTVVIDLKEQAHIVRPNLAFHRRIIGTHLPTHQCVVYGDARNVLLPRAMPFIDSHID